MLQLENGACQSLGCRLLLENGGRWVILEIRRSLYMMCRFSTLPHLQLENGGCSPFRVHSSEVTGPLYLDLILSPSLHFLAFGGTSSGRSSGRSSISPSFDPSSRRAARALWRAIGWDSSRRKRGVGVLPHRVLYTLSIDGRVTTPPITSVYLDTSRTCCIFIDVIEITGLPPVIDV